MTANDQRPPDEDYTRRSFGMRRMTQVQLRSITIVVAALIVLGIGYLLVS